MVKKACLLLLLLLLVGLLAATFLKPTEARPIQANLEADGEKEYLSAPAVRNRGPQYPGSPNRDCNGIYKCRSEGYGSPPHP